MKYTYIYRDQTGFNQVVIGTDLLKAISYAINHMKESKRITVQKIINSELQEVCVFRDPVFNG
jgi:hypothetical protein